MDLRAIYHFLKRNVIVLAIGMVVGALVASIAGGFVPKVYESRSTLLVGQGLTSANPDYTQLLVSQQLSKAYADLVTTRPVRQAVVENASLDMDPDDLVGVIGADLTGDGTLVEISATATDPEEAAAIANAAADEVVRLSPSLAGQDEETLAYVQQALDSTKADIDRSQAELDELLAKETLTPDEERRIDVLQSRLASLRSTYATLLDFSTNSAANLVVVFDRAIPAREPSSPGQAISLVVGAIVGLLIALLVAGMREYLDDTVKTAREVEEVAGVAPLGSVPRFGTLPDSPALYSLVMVLYPRSPIAESVRKLRTNIEFAAIDAPVRSLVVASAMPGEGKSAIAANLAVAYAQAGKRTLLVDSDLRQPRVHELFRLSNTTGLTSLLQADPADAGRVVHETEIPRLEVLTAGPLPPNPAELLGSQRMKALLERLTGNWDVVIMDSPPIELVADGAILASITDGALLVVRAGKTRRAAIRSATLALQRSGARILGVALAGTKRTGGDVYSGYYDEAAAPVGAAAAEGSQPGAGR